MASRDVYEMVKRRQDDTGIETAVACRTFRAAGVISDLPKGRTPGKSRAAAK